MSVIESSSPREAHRSLYELTGADPMRGVAVAELARHMLTIRSAWRYQRLMREIANLISPVREVSPEELRIIIDSLEADGDLTIEGGAVRATPIRAIRLDDWTFKFVSSLTTRRLASLFPGDWTCRESMRICHPIEPWNIAGRVAANGGRLFSAEDWAGLDDSPLADEEWLATVEERLTGYPHPPESEIYGHKMNWEWFSPDGPNTESRTESGTERRPGWRRGKPPDGVRLWRGINIRQYWVYALTRAGSPVDQPWLQLRRDEAHRTIFALARTAGLTVPLSIRQEENLVELTIPPFLPDAEFRYLTVASRLRHSAPHAVRWKFSRSRAPHILEILERRLGLSAGHQSMNSDSG